MCLCMGVVCGEWLADVCVRLLCLVWMGMVVCEGVLKLTWRRVQGDQECSDPGWRLTIALGWVEARDGP